MTANSALSDIARRADELIPLVTGHVEAGDLTTEADAKVAADLLRELKALAKRADDERLRESEPHRIAQKRINTAWEPVLIRINAAATPLAQLIGHQPPPGRRQPFQRLTAPDLRHRLGKPLARIFPTHPQHRPKQSPG